MDCFILTGGASSRMGAPKGGLTLAGASFLRRVAAAAEPVFDRVVAVTRAGLEGEEIPTVHEPEHPGSGAVYGIVTALEHARGARAWIVAVDYPLVSSELLRWLAGRAEESKADVVVPMWRGLPQYLCAAWSTSLLPLLRARIARGELSLRKATEECATEQVSEEEVRARFAGEPLWNVNTREDYDAVKRIVEES